MKVRENIIVVLAVTVLSMQMSGILAKALIDEKDIRALTKVVDQENKLKARNDELGKEKFKLLDKLDPKKSSSAEIKKAQAERKKLQDEINKNDSELKKLHQEHLDLEAKIRI